MTHLSQKKAPLMDALTLPGERILCTIAPPDLWSTQKDTGKTMAELTPEEKNAISHRGKALRAMKELLEKEFAEQRS